MLRIEKCGHQGLPNAEPEGCKNADPKDYQKRSPTFAKCGAQALNNVIAEMYMLRIEICGHRGLPNAEPKVIPENQKIPMMIVKKCTCQELKNADTEDYQMQSLRVKKM